MIFSKDPMMDYGYALITSRQCGKSNYALNYAKAFYNKNIKPMLKLEENTIALIQKELASISYENRRPRASTHEGYACLLEEVDELWDEVKSNGSKERLRAEAVQVAAMAVRFIQELTNETPKETAARFHKDPIIFWDSCSIKSPRYFIGVDPFQSQIEADKATTNHFHLEENAHELKTMSLYERSFRLTKALKDVSKFYGL